MKQKAVIVCHSGGMDSSLCLAWAVKKYGAEKVLALHFNYGQRHCNELIQAKKICEHFQVDEHTLSLDFYKQITSNALMDKNAIIEQVDKQAPNTLVVGRNGLMVRIAAIFGTQCGAALVYVGVIEVESANSGYRDCTRAYMDKLQEILRLDLDNPNFKIKTPLVLMTKAQTMQFAFELGELNYLLENTITCYKGIAKVGCNACPACDLRNEGIKIFHRQYPDHQLPYALP